MLTSGDMVRQPDGGGLLNSRSRPRAVRRLERSRWISEGGDSGSALYREGYVECRLYNQ